MIHIVLLILKIIGIILLCVIGLLILCLCAVLCVPVRYRGSGSYMESEINGEIRVTWLWHLFSMKAAFDSNDDKNKGKFKVKIAGVTVAGKEPKAEKKVKEKSSRKAKPKKTKVIKEAEKSQKTENEAPADVHTIHRETLKELEGKRPVLTEKEPARQEKNSWFSKLKAVPERIKKQINKIHELFLKLKSGMIKAGKKITALCRKKEKLTAILTAPKNRPAFLKVKRTIFKVLRHILPQKFSGWIHFGMEDPEQTGRLLGAAAVLYPAYHGRLNIQPDFDRQIFEAKVSFSGRIRLVTLAVWCLGLVLDKDLRRILSELKNIQKQ